MAARRSRIGLALAGAALGLALFVSGGRAADEEKGVLASLISRALSTPESRVSIGAIEGALSSDATIRNIEIADRDGVWLRLDRARIVWRRLALFQRRLEIDTLEVNRIDIARRPIPAEIPVSGEEQPLLPELPVKVEIKNFTLAELAVGEPILGTPARVTANGAARLGNPAEGLDLRFDARRLDQPGTFAARLGLVPESQRLNLTLDLNEPAGGILARAINIPGLPAVKLNLGGQGTLDAFQARLAFDAGEGIGASGTANLNREGAVRRLGLDLAAQLSGLLPETAAPVFAGTTRLLGNITFADDGAVAVPGIALTAAAARLDITGGLSPTQVADLRVTATNLPTRESRTAVGTAEIRRLAFDARITGALAAPTVDATLAAEDARLPAGRLARLEARFNAVPTGTLGEAATLIRLSADARATGLVLTEPPLAAAIGSEATFRLRGTSTKAGVVSFDTLELKSPTIEGRFTGRAGSSLVNGRLALDAPDLARFSDMAGLALRGGASVTAEVEGTPRANRYRAKLDGRASRFATGIAPVDGLFGGRLDIAGGLRLDPDGGIGFEDLRLNGAHAQARIDGAATPAAADVNAVVTVPNLARADNRLTGRGDVTARITGTLERPDATARIAVTDATALGRPMPRLAIQAIATDIRNALDARVTLDGEIDRKPARGTLHLARPVPGGTVLDQLDIAIGSVALRGGVTLDRANLASGRLTINARNLDDLSPLALQKLSGATDADIQLAAPDGRQNAQVKAAGQRISAYGVALDRLEADVAVGDIYRRPVVSGNVAVDEVTVGGETISHVRLNAQGAPTASDITLTAAARGFDLDARARVIPGDRTRIELTQFGAMRGRQRIALAGPATLTVVEGGIDIRNFALGLGAGRLSVQGLAGRRLDLRAEARAVPLSAAEIFAPGLGLAGTLDGSADITGAASAPAGTYSVRVANLAAPQTRNAGLPPLAVTAAGRLEGTRATLDATVAAGRAGSLRIGGSVPLGTAGPLDVAIRGNLDAGLANRQLGAAGQRVTGSIAIDARVGGTIEAPQASGAATLSGGSFSDAALGIRLDNIRARLVASGEEVTIESASAATRNGGSITAGGRIQLDPGAGFPGSIQIRGQRAQLVQSALATAILNLDIGVTGPLARMPRVSGRVEVVALDVPVPESLPSTLKPLPGTRHIRPTRTAAARLALEARTKKGGKARPSFDAVLDLAVTAPGHIFVHGRGLNAELGGGLRLTGTLANPRAVGAFNLVRGRLQILTTRLDFSRANLTFSGDLSPELDFVASTRAGGVQVDVAITGPASDPEFAFNSSPDLPQDEVLSRLLFGAPAGQLTAIQALALASAAAQYSGGGDGAFEDLRRSLGLGGLDIGLGASGGLGVGLERALGDRVNVGVRAGASAAETGVGVDVRITDEIKVKGQVGSNGAASVGIGAEYEW
jgi:translocation and assembly module TamB